MQLLSHTPGWCVELLNRRGTTLVHLKSSQTHHGLRQLSVSHCFNNKSINNVIIMLSISRKQLLCFISCPVHKPIVSCESLVNSMQFDEMQTPLVTLTTILLYKDECVTNTIMIDILSDNVCNSPCCKYKVEIFWLLAKSRVSGHLSNVSPIFASSPHQRKNI